MRYNSLFFYHDRNQQRLNVSRLSARFNAEIASNTSSCVDEMSTDNNDLMNS